MSTSFGRTGCDPRQTSVFQRDRYDGQPREVAQWWTLKKGQRRAICRMFTHVFGHELRLELSREFVASEVCRTDEEILAC
jgi:hypothetical protein